MDPTLQTTIIPHSQKPLVTRKYPTEPELDAVIQRSSKAQKEWAKVPIQERVAIGRKFMVSYHRMDVFSSNNMGAP